MLTICLHHCQERIFTAEGWGDDNLFTILTNLGPGGNEYEELFVKFMNHKDFVVPDYILDNAAICAHNRYNY